MPSFKIISSVLHDSNDEGEIKALAKKALEKSGFQEVYVKSVELEPEYAFVESSESGAKKLLAALQKDFFTEARISFSSPIKKPWRGVPLEVYPLSFSVDYKDPETGEKQSVEVSGQLVNIPNDVATAFGTFDAPGDEVPAAEVPVDEPEPEGAETGVAEDDEIVKRGRGRPRKDTEKHLKPEAGRHIYSWNAVALLGLIDFESAEQIGKEIEKAMTDAVGSHGPMKGEVYPNVTSTKIEQNPDADPQSPDYMVVSAGVFSSPVAPEDIPKSFSTEEARAIRGILPKRVMEITNNQ